MKSNADLVAGWMRKGDSDLATAMLCVDSNVSLDTACFHAQQAAEKYLKAFLISTGVSFPLIHNIEKLTELCTPIEFAFAGVKAIGSELTPYAVSLRYDEDFWPTDSEARRAIVCAQQIRDLVLEHLPSGASQDT